METTRTRRIRPELILGILAAAAAVLLVAVAAPTLYSYLYYRNHEKGKEQ